MNVKIYSFFRHRRTYPEENTNNSGKIFWMQQNFFSNLPKQFIEKVNLKQKTQLAQHQSIFNPL